MIFYLFFFAFYDEPILTGRPRENSAATSRRPGETQIAKRAHGKTTQPTSGDASRYVESGAGGGPRGTHSPDGKGILEQTSKCKRHWKQMGP